MPFEKGHNKTGGRQKGTPNVMTSQLREIVKEIVQGELDQLREELPNMNSTERRQLLKWLLPYALPATKPVHHSLGENVWSDVL